jgi:hypothetical protein
MFDLLLTPHLKVLDLTDLRQDSRLQFNSIEDGEKNGHKITEINLRIFRLASVRCLVLTRPIVNSGL